MKRFRLCLVAVTLVLPLSVLGEEPKPPNPARQAARFHNDLLVGAHRGGRAEWPENTLAAYREAAKLSPQVLLEGDVHLSKDGVVVMMHDATVNRTTDGNGAIAEKTLAELQALDAGYHFEAEDGGFPFRGKGVQIPIFAEVLATFPDHRFLVETKSGEGIADATVKVIQEAKATDRVLLASFNPLHMHRIRELDPAIPTCYDYAGAMVLMQTLRNGDWDAYVPTDSMLSVTAGLEKQFKITPEEIDAVQAKGILYQVHTLNKEKDLLDAIARGVDSILTDYPTRLAGIAVSSSEQNSTR